MVNNLTPSKLDWFSLAVKDETRDEYIWLKKQSEAIYDIFRGTDLFSNLYNAFLEASIVGTAVIGMQYDSIRKIDFVPLTIGQYWIEEGNNGFVDTCYRRFCMSAKNIVKEFGIDNIPRSVKLALERNEEDELFNVIHAVEPNDNYLPQWENYLNKPFNSVYFVENTGDDEQPLQVAGLSYFPYMVARWDKNITSAYGTGIGESILGDVKSLQKYESDLAKASSKTINPAMLASTQLKNVTKDVSAGSITYADDPTGFKPLYQINYGTNEARQNINSILERIYKLAYNDLFYMLSQKDKTMSATEASGIMQEKLNLLGSVVDRLQPEFLKPLIENCIKILQDHDELVEDVPETLVDKDLEITYQSALANAQQVTNLGNLETVVGFVSTMATYDPNVVLKVKSLDAIEEYAKKMNVDLSLFRTNEEVEEIVAQQKQAEAEAQQQIDANERLVSTAKAAKDFASAEAQGSANMEEMLNV